MPVSQSVAVRGTETSLPQKAIQGAPKLEALGEAKISADPAHPGRARISIRITLKRVSDFHAQAIDQTQLTKVRGVISGLGINEAIFLEGSDSGGFIPFSGSSVNLTFNNVPYGKMRGMEFEFYDLQYPASIDKVLIATAFDLSSANKTVEVSFRTTPLFGFAGEYLSAFTSGSSADKAVWEHLNPDELQTFFDTVTGKVGTAPNYTYTNIHPLLINLFEVMNDLRAQGGNLAGLDPQNPSYRHLPGTLSGTISGLVSSDHLNIRVTDGISPILNNLTNGSYNLGPIQLRPAGWPDRDQWDLVVTPSGGTSYTAQYALYNGPENNQFAGYSSDWSLPVEDGQHFVRDLVLTPAQPSLTGLSVSEGAVGSNLTLTGSNYHANPDGNVVKFGNITVPTEDITVLSSSQLLVKIPAGVSGTQAVTVSVGSQTSEAQNFTVTGGSVTPTEYMVYASDRSGNGFELWKMDADGNNQILLWGQPAHTNNALNPVISPDGTKVAFLSDEGHSGQYTLHIIDNSGNLLLAWTPPRFAEAQSSPSWSPDGSQIVYTGDDDTLYKVNVSGGEPTQLLASFAFNPAWSPDGQSILYSQAGISRIDADGSNPQVLYASDGSAYAKPIWSPDGHTVYFVEHDGTDFEIKRMQSDGSGITSLTNNSSDDGLDASSFFWWGLTVSPDGSHLAYLSKRDGSDELYKTDTDGNNPVRLTSNTAADINVSWWQPIETPVITSLSAASGNVGDTITINGTHFSPVPNQNVVKFGDIEVPPTDISYLSSTQLSVKIPVGCSGNSPVSVRVYNKISNNSSFTVNIQPTISSLSASTGGAGDLVTINGSGFSALAGQNVVKFGNVLVPTDEVIYVSPSQIKARVPAAASEGAYPLSVQVGTLISNNFAFTAQRRLAYTFVLSSQIARSMYLDGSGQIDFYSTGTSTGSGWDWSPIGSRLVFSGYYNGSYNIIQTIYPDGSETGNTYQVGSEPQWSPDGAKMAYNCKSEINEDEICVMNADGSGKIQLTDGIGQRNQHPDWSPDGSKLVFITHRHGYAEMMIMNADGTNPYTLFHDPDSSCSALDYFSPHWSPQGKIVFGRNFPQGCGGNDMSIALVNDGGAEFTPYFRVGAYNAKWSLDGTKLIYQSDSPSQIYISNSDGSNQLKLTNTNPGDNGSPAIN